MTHLAFDMGVVVVVVDVMISSSKDSSSTTAGGRRGDLCGMHWGEWREEEVARDFSGLPLTSWDTGATARPPHPSRGRVGGGGCGVDGMGGWLWLNGHNFRCIWRLVR